jgi:hypothetical protein
MTRAIKMALAAAIVAGTVGAIPVASQASPPKSKVGSITLTQSVEAPITIEANALGKLCTNTGSTLEIGGSVTYNTNLKLKVNLSKNLKDDGVDQESDLIIDLTNVDSIGIDKRDTKVGGNPWLTFTVGSDTVDLGRCVQGATLRGGHNGRNRIDVSTVLTFAECSNRGTFIDFLTDSEAGGVSGTLTIYSTGRRQIVTSTDATLNFAGFNEVRKGKASGIGGNPVVTVFVDTNPGAGENWQQVISPTRCNKLGL